MKNSTAILFSILAFGALLAIGAGIGGHDENGTVRYRNGAILSFDTTATIQDENGAWTVNSTTLSALASATGTLVHSNSISLLPATLAAGDNFYWSSNGAAFVITVTATGTRHTNYVAGP